MRLSGKTARMTLFAILFCLVCPCLFSNTKIQGIGFSLSHEVKAEGRYYFQFLDPTDTTLNTPLTEVSFSNAGTYYFAKLVFWYNMTITFNEISIAFVPLKHSTVPDAYYEYEIQILNPSTWPNVGSTKVQVTPDTTLGHGAGSAVLESQKTFTKESGSSGFSVAEIADFSITLDDSSAIAGSYGTDENEKCTVICYFET